MAYLWVCTNVHKIYVKDLWVRFLGITKNYGPDLWVIYLFTKYGDT